MSTEPTNEGQRLIDAWRDAENCVRQREQLLESARCNLTNTRNALGKWMVPADTPAEEKLSIWYGNELISVKRQAGLHDYTIEIRPRKKA